METETTEFIGHCNDGPNCGHLQSRNRFEQLIFTLATRFLSVSTSDPDHLITNSLKLIGEIFDVEVCRIARFFDHGDDVRVTHGWRSPTFEKRSKERLKTGISKQEIAAIPTSPMYYGAYYYGNWGVTYDQFVTYDYREGTLIVDMIDRPSKELVWRAYLVQALEDSQEKNLNTFRCTVDKAFKNYPPQVK
jgi:Domain of unknown function (DUF4136)